MGGVLTFLFLVFGWIWLSSSLTIENVEVKKSNQTYEVQKSKKDRVTEHLLDRALEKRLKEKMGHLDDDMMSVVNSAIAVSFGLDSSTAVGGADSAVTVV